MTFQVLVSGLSQAQRNPDGHFHSLHGAQVLLGSSGKVSCLEEASGRFSCAGELPLPSTKPSRAGFCELFELQCFVVFWTLVFPSLAWGVPGLKTAAGGTVRSLKQACFRAISAACQDNKLNQDLWT